LKGFGNHSVDARSIVTEDGDYGQVLLSRWPFAEPPKISEPGCGRFPPDCR
jgi:hypothetical protein